MTVSYICTRLKYVSATSVYQHVLQIINFYDTVDLHLNKNYITYI